VTVLDACEVPKYDPSIVTVEPTEAEVWFSETTIGAKDTVFWPVVKCELQQLRACPSRSAMLLASWTW
jgi:hypothetical protein